MTAAALHKQSNEQSSVGVFPENWRSVTVAEVAARKPNAIVGGPFGSDLVSNDYVPLGVPVIRGQNMTAHFVSGEFAFVSLEKAKRLAANTAVPGDIVFTQRGTLGQVALVPKGVFKFYVISQSQMKLSPDPQNFDPTYILQYFVSYVGQRMILESAIQTGVPHTNLGILRAYRLPAPPIEEQRAIAEALSDADALIESLEQLLAKKRHIKQGAMQELLTGTQRLPGFSGEWEVKTLSEGVKLSSGLHVLARNCNTEGDGVAYITGPADFPNGAIQHTKFTTKPGTVCCANDILVTVKGSGAGMLVLADAEYCISRQLMAIRVLSWNTAYVFFSLVADSSLLSAASTGLIPGLSRGDILNKLILLPPTREEQTAIAAVLSDMDTEIAALEAKLTKARAVKQGMMQELLTGRIRLI